MEVFDGEGEAYLTPVDDLKYELRGKNGILHVSGTGTRRYHNVYDIRYEPHASGLYKLDIRVEGNPIFNSPFPVTVLPAFIEAAECIEDVKEPIGIAVVDGGEGLVAAEYGNHCVSIINRDREKETSFGTRGSASGQFDKPEGVAIDHERNILVADLGNHCIQQFSSAGEFLRSVGQYIWQQTSPVQISSRCYSSSLHSQSLHSWLGQPQNSDFELWPHIFRQFR